MNVGNRLSDTFDTRLPEHIQYSSSRRRTGKRGVGITAVAIGTLSRKSLKTKPGRMFASALAILLALSCFLTACTKEAPPTQTPITLELTSTAFADGDKMPTRYTCDGENVSPPLAWGEPPPQTQSFALIVDDPDAPVGVFTHWVIFNIPPDVRSLPEALPVQERLENGVLQGKNVWNKIGYRGPCPPGGSPHHYRFTIYALDTVLDLKPGASKNDLLQAMEGHILAQGQLVGVYQR
jgi:hypothetical protein